MNEGLSKLNRELKLVERIANLRGSLITELVKDSRNLRLVTKILEKIKEAQNEYISFLRERLNSNKKIAEEKIKEIKTRSKK
jgi:hypothetical protein